jgi:hypothetical protein
MKSLHMKKNIVAAIVLTLALSGVSSATAGNAPGATAVPPMPRIFANARFVYVTAYDGDQFDPRLLPEDRDAINRVQDGIHKWGKLIIVYHPEEADMILAVQSRATEDVLAVYDAHNGDAHSRPSQIYLWRVMGRGGLQAGEIPFLAQFEKAWDKIAH